MNKERKKYLKQVAEDYDVPLSKVLKLAEYFGPVEDHDALLVAVDDLSNKEV